MSNITAPPLFFFSLILHSQHLSKEFRTSFSYLGNIALENIANFLIVIFLYFSLLFLHVLIYLIGSLIVNDSMPQARQSKNNIGILWD